MSVQLRRKKLADGRTSLYLDIYHNGKRSYEFLKLYLSKDTNSANKETLQMAQKIRAKRELDLGHAEHGVVPSNRRKTSFFAYHARLAESKTPGTKITWVNALKHMKEYAGPDASFHHITKDWLEGFQNYLRAAVSPNTAYVLFATIKAALRRAVKDEILPSNPTEKVDPITRVDTDRQYLTFEELQRLAATPCSDERVRRAFLFSCYAGLRKSDVRGLRWRNVYGGRIQFRQQKTKGVEYQDLSPQALILLGTPGGAEDAIFPLPDDKQLATVLRRWRRAAEIDKNITFHSARHTFATLLLTYDTDLYTVSKLLGHTNVKITQVYAHMIDQKRQNAVNSLPMLADIPAGATASQP